MKWYNTLALVALCAVAGLTMYLLVHPRVEIVTVTQVVCVPSKPDTVYSVRVKFIPTSPDSEYVVMWDTTEAETIVSEKTFTQGTRLGPLKSLVRAYAPCEVIALSDSAYFTDEQEAMNRIRQEIQKDNKPKFWKGFNLGFTVASVAAITALIATK
jgi:hypothetical protein